MSMSMSTVSLSHFLERTPMREVLDIPAEVLDQAMGVAYQCYRTGLYTEAETLCRGLLAADHRYWWAYSLYAAVLRNQGRLDEALTQVERGLKYEPKQPKLLAMRDEIRTFVQIAAESRPGLAAEVTVQKGAIQS